MRDTTPRFKNKNVFLVETSCSRRPAHRAWCSVESWARQNPNLDVWFILTSLSADISDGMLKTLLNSYPNLHIAGVNLDQIFEGTPLQKLFNSRLWTSRETWPVELLSDMLRVLLLWHWGGFYSDNDVVSTRPMDLSGNMVGFESNDGMVGSAFLSFTDHHQVLWRLMEDMELNFQPQKWGCIGPKAITRVMEKVCQVLQLRHLVEHTPLSCHNITLFPVNYFYPIHYHRSDVYLEEGNGRNFAEEFQSSYLLHFWNKLTKKQHVSVGSDSIYEVAARSFCPLTFLRVTLNSSNF
ncbi:lactosylceramide 4-alpha-galactosyltransferase-like [Panulirus ornatus]|uniref:lactosylceramide 4-alpha-galactosyltransferase-like n=1 Tax=Panulirus ornatus TaxID=150431 RepID=UPI003A84C226